MANYKQGDILLLPFPFSDLSQAKPRPTVIVAKNPTRNGDYIVAKITSNLHNDADSFLLGVGTTVGTLPAISEVRCNELATIDRRIIIKKFTTLTPLALEELCGRIRANFETD
jgi:mRNA interferase MazF